MRTVTHLLASSHMLRQSWTVVIAVVFMVLAATKVPYFLAFGSAEKQ